MVDSPPRDRSDLAGQCALGTPLRWQHAPPRPACEPSQLTAMSLVIRTVWGRGLRLVRSGPRRRRRGRPPLGAREEGKANNDRFLTVRRMERAAEQADPEASETRGAIRLSELPEERRGEKRFSLQSVTNRRIAAAWLIMCANPRPSCEMRLSAVRPPRSC